MPKRTVSRHDSVLRTYYFGNVFAEVYSANATLYPFYERLYKFVKGSEDLNTLPGRSDPALPECMSCALGSPARAASVARSPAQSAA